MFKAWLVKDNPIARLTGVMRRFADVPAARALDRAAPWIGLMLVTILFFYIYDVLHQSDRWRSDIIYWAIAQIIWLVDVLITVRFLWEGMSAGQRLRGHAGELIATTPVSGVRLLLWTGRTALAGAWGWFIVLLWMYLLYGLTIAIGSGYLPSSTLFRLVSALSFAVINSVLAVAASLVIGSAMGLRFRSGYIGLVVALALRYILFVLILLLTLSDRTPYYFTWSHLFVIDRTFIAIGDGGLLALYRLAGALGWNSGRSVLTTLISLHVWLPMIALGSVLFMHTLRPFNWRRAFCWFRKFSVQGSWRTVLLPLILFAAAAIGMVWLWTVFPRLFPGVDTPPFPMVQRDWLRLIQVTLAGILVLCTLVAMRAGMIAVRSQPIGKGIVNALMSMRGWVFGLTLLLMVVALLTLLDHQIDGYGRSVVFADPGYGWRWGIAFSIEYPHAARWHVLQPGAAMAWAIIMGWGVIASGIVLGIGAAALWHRPAHAWVGAIALRAVPVLLGILPPNVVTLPHPGLLAARMNADPLFAIADSGLTVLLGVIDPVWTYQDFCGRTLLSLGVALGGLTFYVNAAFALLPLAIFFLQRRTRTLE